jgi:hypothetical protein
VDTKANNHNGMFDRKGRSGSRRWCAGRRTPDFCQKGSDHPSAKLFPLERTNRALTFLDPKTMKYTFVDTCFQTHHLQFAYDANETVWTSGGGPVVGWVNTKMFDETGDAARSQGWTAFVLDTNGNGKRDDYVEPDQPVDPTKDKRIAGGFYAVMPSPVDGSIWGSVGVFGGTAAVVRVVPGPNPPATALAEIYNVPKPYFGIRGADIDKQGWCGPSMGSGHIGSFDRRKCKGPLNGPKATGDHCPEGWAFYQYPGPGFQGIGENSAESSYYTWVDQHNTFGLGDDVPMSTGNLNDGLIALKDGKMVVLRVPVPAGVLRQGIRRAYRRSGGRLEGARAVDDQRRSGTVAHGRRQGQEADRRTLPAASGSTRSLREESHVRATADNLRRLTSAIVKGGRKRRPRSRPCRRASGARQSDGPRQPRCRDDPDVHPPPEGRARRAEHAGQAREGRRRDAHVRRRARVRSPGSRARRWMRRSHAAARPASSR